MEMCPVNLFELYISKRNKENNLLWQRPKKKVHYTDSEWYEKTRVGHDPLERFMKFLMKDVTLSRTDYTNHSIRATVITNLDRDGFEARHIIAITGHKSESTIKQYSKRCPENKKREMCEALGSKILKKKPKIEPKMQEKPVESAFEGIAVKNSPAPANITLQVADTAPKPINMNDQMELFPFDDTDDDMLLKVLNDLDNNSNNQQNITNTVTNNAISVPTQINPNLMPQMYFPGSTVTINYNFNAK